MSDLVLTGIRVTRERRVVLDTVDARFAARRLTVVIGPNGAGKSTLLAVAAGLLTPDDGIVTLGGTALSALSRRDLAIRRAYLPQNPRVDWPISVERVVALGLSAHLPAFGGLPAHWQPAIDDALVRHDLVPLRDRDATKLSGGEVSRVMLARATVGAPEVLIVDEPTVGLDPRHSLDAARQLRALADGGRTVIVALHDLDLALRIADDVVAIKDATIVAQGPAAAVFTDETLGSLYDVAVRVTHDARGAGIRFVDGSITPSGATAQPPAHP